MVEVRSRLFGKVFSLGFAAVILAAVSVLSFLGDYCSLGDGLSHFRFYWAVGALIVVAAATCRKRWFAVSVAGILFPIHAIPVMRLWVPDDPRPPRSENATELNVVSANLYSGNARKADAVKRLMELSSDVLVLLEISPGWRPALADLAEKYPHQIGLDGTSWLLSRYPLRLAARTRVKIVGSEEPEPLVEATVVLDHTAIRVVATHPPRPIGAAGIAQQKSLAADYVLALQRDKEASHQILIGDFNTSPFSGVFRHIVRTTGLRDSSKGLGYCPTWGPRLPREPILPWLGIPIDHAFMSDRVFVDRRSLGETPGSDHRYQHLKLRF